MKARVTVRVRVRSIGLRLGLGLEPGDGRLGRRVLTAVPEARHAPRRSLVRLMVRVSMSARVSRGALLCD